MYVSSRLLIFENVVLVKRRVGKFKAEICRLLMMIVAIDSSSRLCSRIYIQCSCIRL